jgi:DNA-binding PadR family transcriptional regulator
MTRTEEPNPIEPPLSPAIFHILLALAAGEMHGYAIMQEIAILSDGQVHVGPGTLYGSIKRLLAAGLIEESGDRPDPRLDDERRRYYRLTQDGHRILTAEAERMQGLVRAAQARKVVGDLPALGLGEA